MAKVPGTFKQRVMEPVRVRGPNAQLVEQNLLAAGALVAECWVVGECSAIVAREPYQHTWRWHVSVSHTSRYPTWDEIKTVVYGIPTCVPKPGKVYAQLLGHVEEGDWVDVDKNCFHLYEIDDPLGA